MTIKSFGIVGGDMRQVKLGQGLQKKGYPVLFYGFDKLCDILCSPFDWVAQSDVLVLPLPMTTDGETINMPLSNHLLNIKELLGSLSPKTVVVGGKIPQDITIYGETHAIQLYDYFLREELMVGNAIPTVEGGIQLAMEEMGITLHGCKSLVLGYGRIGKLMAHTLLHLGSDVSVVARSYSDLAWIKCYGYHPIHLNQLAETLPEYDVVFNTIPHVVMPYENLCKLKKECLVIDLASKPGGIDFAGAQNAGIKCIWALSLPGKVAPVTAGEIIMDAILNILQERGNNHG